MRYTLGPVLWYWPADRLRAFYQQAAQSSASVIYLGESVCSKRRAVRFGEWMEMARLLAHSGKQVVLSTLALLQSPSEISELRRYVENGEFMLEANDIGTVNMVSERRLPFVAGSALNIYNAETLQLLLKEGMMRWCTPVEMSRDRLQQLLEQCDSVRHHFEVEVTGYGHLPLALSARCFTARSENRAKDNCETCCQHYPAGRLMRSQEGESLFVLNGIQTLSSNCYNLGNDLCGMRGWVDLLRLLPRDEHTLTLIERFRANETGTAPLLLEPGRDCNGYWRNIAGMALKNG